MKVLVEKVKLNAAIKTLWKVYEELNDQSGYRREALDTLALHNSLAAQASAEPVIWYFIIDGNRSDYMGPDVELFTTEQAAQARLIEWANDFMSEGEDDTEPVETFAEAEAYVNEMVIGTNIYIDSRPLQG